MVRAMTGVRLFGGCRVDEIRRLEPPSILGAREEPQRE
jgi:hypothetical protein